MHQMKIFHLFISFTNSSNSTAQDILIIRHFELHFLINYVLRSRSTRVKEREGQGEWEIMVIEPWNHLVETYGAGCCTYRPFLCRHIQVIVVVGINLWPAIDYPLLLIQLCYIVIFGKEKRHISFVVLNLMILGLPFNYLDY